MAFEQLPDGGFVITGKEDIDRFRLMTLRSGLYLEMKGIKVKRGRSCFSIVREEFGLRGSRQKVYDAFCAIHNLPPVGK